MSKHHDLTTSYGESLVTCEHQFEASYYYHQVREQCMNHIHEISKAVAEFTVDFTDESLKILELLYYDLEDSNCFDYFSMTKEEFEECMGVYFGEVVTSTIDEARWVVKEYPLMENKYVTGIEKGNLSLMFPHGFFNHKERHPESVFTLYHLYKQLQK